MKRITRGFVAGVCAATMAAATVSADVKTEEKGHVKFEGMLGRMVNMFGGKGAREGVVTRVAVKGDRKLSMTDKSGQLIDLAEEKIYDIDFEKKSYKVTTFEELRQRMREAEERAKKSEEKADDQDDKDQEEDRPAEGGKEYEIDVDVKETGAKKALNGHDTRQVITTVTVREKGKTLEQAGGMVLALDSWLAQTVAALKEVQEFDVRYMQKLHGPLASGVSAEQMAAAMAMYPMLKEALGRVNKEGANLEGTPIATTLTVQAVKSPEQLAQESEEESESGGGGLGGMLARKMKRKKADAEGPKNRATVMTTTHEVLSVSTTVASGDVSIPADFKVKS
jgi:hypothetical protein